MHRHIGIFNINLYLFLFDRREGERAPSTSHVHVSQLASVKLELIA